MIIPMIFIFLSCCEKANDNKKFSHETLLWITNSNPLSQTLEAGLPKKADLDSLQIWQGVWQERRVVFLRGVDTLMHTTFTFSLLTSILSSQLAFSKSEINKFWSKFFQFLLNIFDLDLGEFAKKISNIYCKLRKVIRGCWCKIDMFELKVTLQKMLSIKVEEELEIFVGSNTSRDRKLDESVSTKLLTGLDVSYCTKIYAKITKKKNFLWVFFVELFWQWQYNIVCKIIHL